MSYVTLAWFAVGLVLLAGVLLFCIFRDIRRDALENKERNTSEGERLKRHLGVK